jgi:hypothetical protein
MTSRSADIQPHLNSRLYSAPTAHRTHLHVRTLQYTISLYILPTTRNNTQCTASHKYNRIARRTLQSADWCNISWQGAHCNRPTGVTFCHLPSRSSRVIRGAIFKQCGKTAACVLYLVFCTLCSVPCVLYLVFCTSAHCRDSITMTAAVCAIGTFSTRNFVPKFTNTPYTLHYALLQSTTT